MKISMNYINNSDVKLVGFQKKFKQIALLALKKNKFNGIFDFSVTIVDDKVIHEYNKQYRNIDRPTDVLSFAFNDFDDGIVDEEINSLGDIIISIETCKRQAKEYGHSLTRELCFLFTHGFLHLLGYDHMNEKDENKMFSLQDEILNELNILR